MLLQFRDWSFNTLILEVKIDNTDNRHSLYGTINELLTSHTPAVNKCIDSFRLKKKYATHFSLLEQLSQSSLCTAANMWQEEVMTLCRRSFWLMSPHYSSHYKPKSYPLNRSEGFWILYICPKGNSILRALNIHVQWPCWCLTGFYHFPPFLLFLLQKNRMSVQWSD